MIFFPVTVRFFSTFSNFFVRTLRLRWMSASVAQLGCILYIHLRSVIGRHPGVHHHGYADDRQLYTQFNLRDVDSYRHALQRLEMSVEEVRVWLLTNN